MIRNQQVLDYWPMDGVNLSVDPNVIPDSQCVSCQNMTFLFGEQKTLTKRLGSILNQTVTAGPIQAAIFFSLPGVAPIPIVAIRNAAGDQLWGGNPLAPMTGPTLAANGTWTLIEYAGVVYMFNGYSVYTTTSGTSYVEATLPAYLPDIPLSGFIYLDRMYYRFSSDSPYANSVYYSDVLAPLSMSFSTQNITVGQFLGENVTGMGYLSWASAQTGPIGSLGIWKRNGMWVLTGDPVLSNSALSQTSDITGCLNANTVVNTPAGTIWVSPDNIYLNQNGMNVPIGNNIFPAILNIVGTGLSNQMFAVFHNNFYKLYLPDGQGNIIGYWYNVLPKSDIQSGWYGPMTGINFSCMAVDPSDNWFGADNTAGNWYSLDADVYTDNGVSYNAILKTKVFDLKEFSLLKKFFISGFEGDAGGQGSLTIQTFFDGNPGGVYYFPYGQPQSLWDVAQWDVNSYSGSSYFNNKVYFSPPVTSHNTQFIITQSDPFLFNMERGMIVWAPSRKVA